MTSLPIKSKENVWFAVKKLSPWSGKSFRKNIKINLQEYSFFSKKLMFNNYDQYIISFTYIKESEIL